MRDTPYARELVTAVIQLSGSEGRIERLYNKRLRNEEIRFSWWRDGKLKPRPLDLSEEDLVKLFREAIGVGVFKQKFLDDLRSLL